MYSFPVTMSIDHPIHKRVRTWKRGTVAVGGFFMLLYYYFISRAFFILCELLRIRSALTAYRNRDAFWYDPHKAQVVSQSQLRCSIRDFSNPIMFLTHIIPLIGEISFILLTYGFIAKFGLVEKLEAFVFKLLTGEDF